MIQLMSMRNTKRQSRYFLCLLVLLMLASIDAWRIPPILSKNNNYAENQNIAFYAGDDERRQPSGGSTISRRQLLLSTLCITTALRSSPPALASTATELPKTVTIPPTCNVAVSIWNNEKGRTVYLLGTVHSSSSSAKLAGDLIRNVTPDAILVELDRKRDPFSGSLGNITSLSEEIISTITSVSDDVAVEQPNNIRYVAKLSRDNSIPSHTQEPGIMAWNNVALKSTTSKSSDLGQEMVVALRQGHAVGAKLIFGDVDIDVTQQRLNRALYDLDPDQLREIWYAYNGNLSADEREKLKLRMAELKKVSPEVYNALIGERDIYMANGIDQLNAYSTLIAVMGIAHIDGVESYLKEKGWVKLPCPT